MPSSLLRVFLLHLLTVSSIQLINRKYISRTGRKPRKRRSLRSEGGDKTADLLIPSPKNIIVKILIPSPKNIIVEKMTTTAIDCNMESSTSSSSHHQQDFLQDLLECSVCFEQLDITSKVLPCQHTFCKRCLEGILFTHRELRCPECRILVDVPSISAISELPCNILLIRLLEGIKNNNSPGSLGKNKTSSSLGKRGSTSRNSFRIAQEIFAQQQQQQNQCNMVIPSQNSPPITAVRDQSSLPAVIQARAMCSYEAKANSNEVSFKGGDMLTIQRRIDANWSYGTVVSTGRTGLFPSSLVQIIANLESPPQTPVVRALYDFSMELDQRDGRECLSFKKNDIIHFIRRVDENWASGRLGDQTGIFPLNFVEVTPVVAMMLRQQHPSSHQQSNTINSSNCSSTSNHGTNNTKLMQTYGNHGNNDSSLSNNNEQQREYQVFNMTHPKSSGTTTANIIYDVVSSSSPCQSTIVKSETKPFITSVSLNGSSSKTSDEKKDSQVMTTTAMMIMSNNNSNNGTTNGLLLGSSSGNNETSITTMQPANHSPESHPSLFSHQSIGAIVTPLMSLSSTDPKEVVLQRQATNDHSDYSSMTTLTTQHTTHKRHSLCAPILDSSSCLDDTSVSSSHIVHQRSVSHTPSGSTANPRYSMDIETSFGRQNREAFPSPISTTEHDRSTYGSTGVLSTKPMVTASALYTAMFDYKPSKTDELELVRGRLYCVSEKCLDGWYRGSCLRTSASGVFPGNYVQIVKPNPPANHQNNSHHNPNETHPMTAADSRFSAVYHTPGRGIPKDPRYQTIYPTSSATRTSSPPPLRPKTFGWKSSELLSSERPSTFHQSGHQNATSSSSSQLYAKSAKTRTLPLNFSSRRKSRNSKSPASRGETVATTANTPSPQWQPV